jgi:hypothetical protein
VNRQPFIVGFGADKVLGFLAGFFGSVMGLIAAIVVMFVWAGGDPQPDTEGRRRHARSVSIWAGAGCAFPAILAFVLLFVLMAGAVMVTTHTQGPGPVIQFTPIPVFP